MGSLYLNFQGIEGYLGYIIPVFFKFISLSAIKHLRYRSTHALWTLGWAPEYWYNYITINIRVWSPARPAKDVSSTDLSVKMQPHKFANGIAFAAGHINWFWYLEKVEGVYLMPAQFYFKQFWEVEGNLWVKGFLSFVWKRKHCSNHVFNTIPCLQFVPLLRCVEKNNNLALCRYSLDAGSIRYIISSQVLMLFHVEGFKFAFLASFWNVFGEGTILGKYINIGNAIYYIYSIYNCF